MKRSGVGRQTGGALAGVPSAAALVCGLTLALAGCAPAGGAKVTWYSPREVMEPGDKPPALGMKLISWKPEFSFLAPGEKLAPRGQLAFAKQGVVALLVYREKPGDEAPALAVKLVDPNSRKVLWEKPWPFKVPRKMAIYLDTAGIFAGPSGVIAASQEGDIVTLNLRDGESQAAVPAPKDRQVLSVLGTLEDGRVVMLSARNDAGSQTQEEGHPDDLLQTARQLDLRVHVSAGSGHEPQDLPLQGLVGAKATGLVTAGAVTPAGLLFCAEERSESDCVLHVYDIAAKALLWSKALNRGVLDLKVNGVRIIVQLGDVLWVRHPAPMGLPGYRGTIVLDLQTGRVRYWIDADGRGSRGRFPKHAHILDTVHRLDLYEGENADGDKVAFAVDSRNGKPAWCADRCGNDLADFNESTGEVTLMSWIGSGLRFRPTTGEQTAAIEVEGSRQNSRLDRVGNVWILDGAVLTATETMPVRSVRIPGGGWYIDTKLNATVIPPSDQALKALFKALKDRRVEYRRGAVEGLRNFCIPSEAGPAIKPLAGALSDPDAEVRCDAAWALWALAPHVDNAKEAGPALAKVLGDSDEQVRSAAAIALGTIDPDSDAAGGALVKLVDDADPDLRSSGRAALVGMKAKYAAVAAAAIQRDLESKEAKVRTSAALDICHAGDSHRRVGSVSAFIPVLARLLLEDPDREVRLRCANALEVFGPAAKSAVPALRKAQAEDKDEAVRRFATNALRDIEPAPKR
jgi:hypothetical protein